MQQYGLTYPFL